MATDARWGGSGSGSHAQSDRQRAPFALVWWLVALRGVAGILFGLIALFVPGATILSILLVFSAYMLVDGGFGVVSAIMAARRAQRWGLLLLEGLADIATGIIVLLWPAITIVAFILLLAAWAIVTGVLMLGAAFKHKRQGWGWLAFSGITSIIFGMLLAIAPFIGAVVLTWWLGAYALVFGVMLLVFGFKLRTALET
jgi:uncharacterized membrane protein HdeD (DUF308 family)